MSQRPSYCFYPTLLDGYQRYIDTRAEDFFYMDADGRWHRNYNEEDGTMMLSQDEVDAMLEQELLDRVNRVVGLPSEAASRGTIFNEIVDCIIAHRPCGIEGATIQSCPAQGSINATIDGFEFAFDTKLCKQVATMFSGALSQYRTEATIDTCYGTVMLYGYIDELLRDRVYDIKTTKNYKFGNYAKYWQRHVYPYCLVESGDCTEVSSMEFTIVKLSGGTSRTPIISGEIYREVYNYDHDASTSAIRQVCERFIEWLHDHRRQITDRKIYGL